MHQVQQILRLHERLKVACLSTLSRWAMALGLLSLLAACASPITTRVTSFNQWPANAAGSTFSYMPHPDRHNELEQQTYQTYVQVELEKLGLKRAATGQAGRFQVDLETGNGRYDRRYLEPIYQNTYVYRPAFRDRTGRVYGAWGPDMFGPRYVGDREVIYTVQVSSLRLRLLDSQGSASGTPRTVFESNAVYEGDIAELPDLVPYLVRSVFEGFPGQNGKVRVVKFDSKTGAMIAK
jgi:Domain of unknown function (DUF4136)